MLVSFFESVKYVGHLLPISFLRIFLGYYYLQQALMKYHGDFLVRPKMAAQVAEILPSLQVPGWYSQLVEFYFIPHWQVLAFTITGIEFVIAISYIMGYVVRPVSLLGLFLCANLWALSGPSTEDLFKTFFAIHLILGWVGAGRCLGFDYYFYKRRRGIWW